MKFWRQNFARKKKFIFNCELSSEIPENFAENFKKLAAEIECKIPENVEIFVENFFPNSAEKNILKLFIAQKNLSTAEIADFAAAGLDPAHEIIFLRQIEILNCREISPQNVAKIAKIFPKNLFPILILIAEKLPQKFDDPIFSDRILQNFFKKNQKNILGNLQIFFQFYPKRTNFSEIKNWISFFGAENFFARKFQLEKILNASGNFAEWQHFSQNFDKKILTYLNFLRNPEFKKFKKSEKNNFGGFLDFEKIKN